MSQNFESFFFYLPRQYETKHHSHCRLPSYIHDILAILIYPAKVCVRFLISSHALRTNQQTPHCASSPSSAHHFSSILPCEARGKNVNLLYMNLIKIFYNNVLER